MTAKDKIADSFTLMKYKWLSGYCHFFPCLSDRDPDSSVGNVIYLNSRLESQMFDRPKRPGLTPLTPVLPDANDRIHTPGYAYNPVHTEIYGTYRANAKRLY